MTHASRAQDIATSTTGSLDGWEITEYLGVVSAHVVAGTGLFSDVAASFSDVFGGRSTSYKRQLEDINDEAVAEIKEQAAQKNADAVVGLKIDHDEISGQQKGMLMVTATGTAVRAEPPARPQQAEETASGPVSGRRLSVQMRTQDLVRQAKEGALELTEDTWQFLIEHRVAELAGTIRATLVEQASRGGANSLGGGGGTSTLSERSRDYFLAIDREVAKKHLYNMLYDRSPTSNRRAEPLAKWTLAVMEEGRMLDFRWVDALLDEDTFLPQKRALAAAARLKKLYYTAEDAERLRAIRSRIENGFGKRGEVREVEESSMFSSETKQVWQIEGGEQNPMDREYCRETGLNIYGFRRPETKPEEAIREIDRKIRGLEALI